ncbi:tetratricopeptide repeat protein [Aquabacterium sp.]|uniref:tetratricopeptide repeat protein n=1 Tax=Aquabacterium sp. TaxID=1872578 RepID=UPI002BAF2F55|nr:tetratricopeptide repeat protein [Aquabacterium sp.]HSW09063.1 tetratricopeptide repeat protein [Aquabacterium sp.]
MARWVMLLLAWCFAGCASPPVVINSDHLFADALFKPPTVTIAAEEVLRLSPAMRSFLRHDIGAGAQRRAPNLVLLDALYTRNQLKLRYDTTMTRNAVEAFDARAGNCMSLVIMTAAFARELGLPVRYQSVYTDPNWGRRGNLYFTIGHINLSVGRPRDLTRAFGDSADWVTVDFLPQRDLLGQRFQVIEEPTLIAMYMNNKAAEALSAGQLDDAYWWIKAALQQDKQLLFAYNTLGVIYQRHGNLAQAEQTLRFALARDPDSVQVVGNLAQLLTDQGRSTEAQPLFARLARLQPDPPFKFFELGRTAMQQGEYRQAKALFERELARDPDYHEFHFWLALAYLKLGDSGRAARHLAAARDNSNSGEEEALYAAKLARLKAETVH